MKNLRLISTGEFKQQVNKSAGRSGWEGRCSSSLQEANKKLSEYILSALNMGSLSFVELKEFIWLKESFGVGFESFC